MASPVHQALSFRYYHHWDISGKIYIHQHYFAGFYQKDDQQYSRQERKPMWNSLIYAALWSWFFWASRIWGLVRGIMTIKKYIT